MAQIELQPGVKTKRKVHSFLRIDMTPMVDLGFLLITFFIFTTTMSDKKAMRLIMPAEGGNPPAVKESEVLTVLLGKSNNVYAYEGKFTEAVKNNKIIVTSYNEAEGIGKLIRDKQKQLQANKINGKERLVYLIKPSALASYKNVIDALDETTINNVKKYMIVDPAEEEKIFLQNLP
jgi:biopolymer transport protein ExbD